MSIQQANIFDILTVQSNLIFLEMANFEEILNSLLGILVIIVLMLLAYAYLKPHRLHKRRLVSTILLKVSYLVYLFNLLIIVYTANFLKGGVEKIFPGIESYILFLLAIVPTVGIFFRKRKLFNKNRDSYNYFFSVVNIVALVFLVIMYLV